MNQASAAQPYRPMTPQQFIKKWKPVALTERAAAQSHFIDLCAVLGHDDPVAADPTGDSFTFEKGVTKTGGGDGFADVWKKGFFAWEYKKKKRNLEEALGQLVRYAAALENPPLQVACDTDRFLIRTAWTNTVPKTYEFTLEDLAEPANLDILHSVFFDPEKLRPKQTRAAITKDAADKFSTIALRLQGRGTPEEIAHFVNQLVFCFFAHSVKLLPDGFFPRLLKRASETPENAQHYFNNLFAAMEKGGDFDLTRIAHFNGGLFDGRRALPLDSGDVGLLIAAGSLDWAQIDPTIFGTLFERFLDPEKRGQIGAHYTDPDKIMMLVEPVILRPLRTEWAQAKEKIEGLLSGSIKPSEVRLDRAGLMQAGMRLGQRRRLKPIEAAEEVRSQFLERLRTVSILDPACGSGNFLYLALQGVKDIELRANLECEALGLSPRVPVVGPEIVHGIEINPLAAELARTTIWIGDIQWGIRNAIYARPEPILRPLDAIQCRDALISPAPLGGNGQSEGYAEAEWPAAEFIVGNPPFLGGKLMLGAMGEDYVRTMRRPFEGRLSEFADLVCYWFDKANKQLDAGRTSRVGFVATNSIRGGANRRVLDDIAAKHRFIDAWSDEPWIVEGAAVRVSLVCFGKKREHEAMQLNGQTVNAIYPDLTSGATDLTRAVRLPENGATCFEGGQKHGPFELPGDVARDFLRAPNNPNGRPNADVLFPYLNAADLVRRQSDTWIIAFPDSLSERQAALYEAPFEYVRTHVKPIREHDKDKRKHEFWWRHHRSRPELRKAITGLDRFIATPVVAKWRVFVWIRSRVLATNLVDVIARDDDVCFGILHSRFHEAWSLRRGTWLGVGNDPRYTPTTTFETFPFPEGLTPNIPAKDYANDPRAIAIATAAKRLDDLRNAWLNPPDLVCIEPEVVPGYPDRILPKDANAAAILRQRTLTNLYNQRPQWLADAHRDLDAAVAAAYGWPADISEDDALGKLLELNLARTAASPATQRSVDDGEDD